MITTGPNHNGPNGLFRQQAPEHIGINYNYYIYLSTLLSVEGKKYKYILFKSLFVTSASPKNEFMFSLFLSFSTLQSPNHIYWLTKIA